MADLTLTVHPGTCLGPLPTFWRPSVMSSFGRADAQNLLIGLSGTSRTPPEFGYIRQELTGFQFGVSDADVLAQNTALIPFLLKLQALGATFIFTMPVMPYYLAPNPNPGNLTGAGVPFSCTVPPVSNAHFGAVIQASVAALAAAGITGAYYEFWNEPDPQPGVGGVNNFWNGDGQPAPVLTNFHALYTAMRPFFLAGDPLCKVGGSGFTLSFGPPYPTLSYVLAFAKAVTALGSTYDFLSYHHYQGNRDATFGIAQLAAFPAQITAAGLPTKPIFVTEYNLAPLTGNNDHNTSVCQGYMPAVLHNFENNGVLGATFATLQDFNANEVGGQGMTTEPLTTKPVWTVQQQLAQMGSQRIPIDAPANYIGVNALATRTRDTVQVLLGRYDTVTSAIPRTVQILGVPTAPTFTLQPFDSQLVTMSAT